MSDLYGKGPEDLVFLPGLIEKCTIDKLPSNLRVALPYGWLLDDGTIVITRIPNE